MLWWALALVSGFYGTLIDDPADMRFCVAAGEAEARADPDQAMLHQLVARKFLLRLADVGAMDAEALDEVRSGYESSAENRERYEHCRALALSIPEGGDLSDAALALDDPDFVMAVDEAAAEVAAERGAEAAAEAAAAGAAAAAEAAAPAAVEELADDWLPTYRDLRDTRIAEVRCAMLASLVVAEIERGLPTPSHGLTRAGAETLGGRLAAAIMAETGYDAARVRALYKYDFELFYEITQMESPGEAGAKAAFDAAMTKCRPLYAGIDAAAGTVATLAPVRIDTIDTPLDRGGCYAMLSLFAEGMAPGSREGKAFGAMLKNLDGQFAAAGGDVAAAKAAARAGFDADAFQDLSEAHAEVQMERCFAMAGGG